MSKAAAPADEQMERGLLGTVLVTDEVLPALVAVEGITPDVFFRPSHARAFEAMVDLSSEGGGVDGELLRARLEGQVQEPGAFVALLYEAAAPTFWEDYARRLKTLARMRAKMVAAQRLADAAAASDPEGVAEAEAELAASSDTRGRRRSTAERRGALVEMVEGRGVVWPTPWGSTLNDLMAGGLRPGQLTMLVGPTSHGKSVAVQQLLTYAADRKARCALYTNEMEASELDARDVAHRSGVPFMRVITGTVDPEDRGRVDDAITSVGASYTLVEAAGMTADEIAYDLRRERWDVAVIDLFNGMPNSTETKDIDRNMGIVAAACRQSGAHVVGCQHLNQARAVGKLYPPEPVLADIRGSGGIGNLANNVMFVYLKESLDKPGQSSTDAVMGVLKWRGGVRGRAELDFDPHKMRFFQQPPMGTVIAA